MSKEDWSDIASPVTASMDDWSDIASPVGKKKETSSAARRIADVPLGIAKGIADLPGAAVGLLDIPTNGLAGKAVDAVVNPIGEAADAVGVPNWARPTQLSNTLGDLYSPEMKQAKQNVHEAFVRGEQNAADAGGGTLEKFIGGIAEGAPAFIKNPAAAVALATENYGGMKAIAKGTAKMLAPAAAKYGEAVKAGTMTQEAADAALANSAGRYSAVNEGLLTAGQNTQQVEHENPDASFADRAMQGVAGAITGGISRGVSKIPRLGDVEANMALRDVGSTAKTGLSGGRLAAAGKSAFSEGVLEELPQSMQEQVWQNLGTNKPWDSGLAEQAVSGLVAGGAMGGAMGALSAKPGAEKNDSPIVPIPKESINLVTDPDPLQERIDSLLGIGNKPMNDTERTQYAKDLESAFGEVVGHVSGKDGLEIPVTMEDYLRSQLASADITRDRPKAENAVEQSANRLQQLADEESTQQPDIAPPGMGIAAAPIIPVVGALSAAANLAVQTGAHAATVAQQAAAQTAQNTTPEGKAGTPAGAQQAGSAAASPAGGEFDVSKRTEQQLTYLALKGKPGWKEAAVAELQKRGVKAGSEKQANSQFEPNGLQPGTPEYNAAYQSWMDARNNQRAESSNKNQRAENQSAVDQRNKWRSRFRDWFNGANDGDSITDVTGQRHVVTVKTRKDGKVVKSLVAVDQNGKPIDGAATGIGKVGDRLDGLNDGGIDPDTGSAFQETDPQSFAASLGQQLETGEARTSNQAPADVTLTNEGETTQAPEAKAEKPLKSPTEGGPEDSIGWTRMTIVEREGLLIRAGYGGKGRALNLGGAGAINRSWENMGKGIREKLIAAHEAQFKSGDQNKPASISGKAGIDSWRSEFESAKKDGDKAKIQALYDKVRIVLNGIAQSHGDKAVSDFNALKKEIEQYAKNQQESAADEQEAGGDAEKLGDTKSYSEVEKKLINGEINVEDFMSATGLTDDDVGFLTGNDLRQQADVAAKENSPYFSGIRKLSAAIFKEIEGLSRGSTAQSRRAYDANLAKYKAAQDTLEVIAKNFEHPFRNTLLSKLPPFLESRYSKQWDSVEYGDKAKKSYRSDSYSRWVDLLIDAARKKSDAKQINNPDDSKPDQAQDFSKYILISADDISKLRKIDVERVLSQGNVDRQKLADYIKRNRSDLVAEVNDVMAELSAPAVDAVSQPKTDAAPEAKQDKAPAITPQHVENGESEPATAAVVEQSLMKGAANSPLDLRQERDLLLKKVDSAIAAAPTAEEKDAWNRVEQRIDLANNMHVADTIGYRVFDVPGDGKFKVLNLKEALQRFRERIDGNPGFSKPRTPSPQTKADWQKTGRGGTEATIKEFIDDGELLTAVEYAKQIGKPLVFGQYQDGSSVTVYTDSKPFEHDGYDDFKMVSARAAGAADKVAWAVIDLGSGMTVSSKHPTRMKAIAETHKALAKMNAEQLATNVKSAKANSGFVGTQEELEQRWVEWVAKQEELHQAKNEQEQSQPKPQGVQTGLVTADGRVSSEAKTESANTSETLSNEMAGFTGVSDAEYDLRKLSRAEKRDGDIELGNGKFVTLEQAVEAAKKSMDPADWSKPFQFNRVLDIAPIDWNTMVGAMKNATVDAKKQEEAKPSANEPWQMTRKEWYDAKNNDRAETFGSSGKRNGAAETAARIERKARLNYGVAENGEPVDHRQVIEKAIADGKQIPDEVLADYPDLKESGIALLSPSLGRVDANKVDIAVASKVVADLLSGWRNAPDSRVVATFDDLPAAVRKEIEDQGEKTARGVFHGDTFYLIADEHASANEIEETIFHEVWAHYGLRSMLGANTTRELAGVFDQISASGIMGVNGKDAFRAFARRNGFNTAQTESMLRKAEAFDPRFTEAMKKRILVEELIAKVQEKGDNPSLKRKAQEIIGAIREWLRKVGFSGLMKYSDADLMRLVQKARDTVKYGKRGSSGKGDVPSVLMTAWHGSPHDHDKFDSSKIGTGEGAQAYGYGHYFAGAKDVAEWYRRKLSGADNSSITFNGKQYGDSDAANRKLTNDVKKWAEETGRDPERIDVALEYLAGMAGDLGSARQLAAKEGLGISHWIYGTLNDLSEHLYPSPNGRLYQVELAPTADEYLDWDKPLSEQSEFVRNALTDKSHFIGEYLSDTLEIAKNNGVDFNERGDTLYKIVSDQYGSDKAASDYLHSIGIRGIRYLDGSSRSAGEGNSNYVIFNDADVSITAKYNKAGKDKLTPADKAIYGMAADGKSAAEILKFIASASRNPFYRQLAKLLMKTGITPSITVGDGKGWKMNAGEGNKYAAGYNPTTNTVSLFRPASAERNMMHELVHAATLKALSGKGMASAQMNALYQHVKKSGKLKGMYGMSDVDEFIAEAFSNPKFQAALKQVSAAPVGGKPSSAWDWFVRVVRGILGLKQGADNALSKALEIGVGVMRENMEAATPDTQTGYAGARGSEMQERPSVRAVTGSMAEPAQSKVGAGGKTNAIAISDSVQASAIKAAQKVQDESNAFDLEEEIKSVSENGESDLSSLIANPKYWDAENEEFTDEGYKQVDLMNEQKARDNLRLLSITDLSDLDSAYHKAQYAAMVSILDGMGIEYKDTSSNSSKYLEVGRLKLRFANHANTTRSVMAQVSNMDEVTSLINVAPGEYKFAEALDAVMLENMKATAEAGGTHYAEGQKQTDTTAFRKWFGDSKVVDANGDPLVVYHGTGATDISEFKVSTSGTYGGGIYLTPEIRGANDYAIYRGAPSSTVYPVYAAIKNPASGSEAAQVASWKGEENAREELIKRGYDGVVDMRSGEIVAFYPEQIKSAIGNNGEFDPSNPDIRYNVADEGWSVSEQAKKVVMRLAGRPMADPSDPFAAENSRLREQDQSLWSKAKKQLRRYLAPGGLLPQSVFAEKIKRDSEFQAVEFDVRHLIGGLEQAVKADFGMAFDKLSKEKMRPITEALAGNVPASLPDATKTAAVAMRQYIDGMSTEYLKIIQQKIDTKMLKAIESGKDSDKAQAINEIELFEKIKGNIGRYVHRSYQAFDDPKWFEKVPAPVLNASRLYLKQGYMEAGETDAKAAQLAEVTLHEILKNGTAYDSMESFIAESKLGAKDLSVLMRRKEVPTQIRALLGEYQDARLNFTKSATKMGRLIWNTRFLDRVRDIGIGSFFFEGKDRPPEATTQIAAGGSEVYAPLNGLWTFPEIAQSFKDALGKEQMSDLYRAIVRANGLVKYGKTILAPTTAMRNWQSAMFFSLANGHFDLTQMKKSISAFREQVSQKATGQDLKYLRHLKQLGVVYDTPYAGEMARLMEDARMDELLSSDKGDAVRWFRKANQLAQGFYTFGDDFWKIIGFENEKAGLMKAGLSLQEAEAEAAKRIRDTYPTYSMVGRGVQWLSRFPLAGTFVSFPAEIIRTSSNMLRTVVADLKSDNPKLRELGMKRAAGMAFVSAAFYGLAALSMAMAGVGDDEDEAIRDLAPEWQKNSTFLYLGRDEKGNLRYFDMSFLDPYGYWKRPITAILRNQPWEDSLASGLRGMLEPFLGADISAKAIFEAVANQKENGSKVYKEKDGSIDQAIDIADHLRKALQPGVVGNVERLVKAAGDVRKSSGQPYSMEDELVALAGWRATTIDPKTALYYRSFDFTDSISEARKTLTDTLRDANSVSPEDIKDAKARAASKQEQAFKEMSRLIGAAEAAGMSKMQIVQTMRLSNISQANIAALMRGSTPDVSITPQLAARAVRQASQMRGPEYAAEVFDRYRQAMAN